MSNKFLRKALAILAGVLLYSIGSSTYWGGGHPLTGSAFADEPPSYSITLPAHIEHGTITIKVGETEYSPSEAISAHEGDTVTVTLSPDKKADGSNYEYDFDVRGNSDKWIERQESWEGDKMLCTFTMPASNVTITAEFFDLQTTHSISYYSLSDSTGNTILAVTLNKRHAETGETITLTITLAENIVLDSLTAFSRTWDEQTGFTEQQPVTLTMSDDTHYTFTMPAEDVEIFAECHKTGGQYSITVTPNDRGTISPVMNWVLTDSANEGDTVEIQVHENEGYALVSLTVTGDDGASITVNDRSFSMPAQNVTVSAVFKPYIQRMYPEHGSIAITVNGQEANGAEEGETVTVLVTPEEGYELGRLWVYWSSEGFRHSVECTKTSTANTYTFTMPKRGVTVDAVFGKPLTGSETALTYDYYLVKNDITYSGGLTFTENPFIILAEGVTLTAQSINGGENGLLNILAPLTGKAAIVADKITASSMYINGGNVDISADLAIAYGTLVASGTLNGVTYDEYRNKIYTVTFDSNGGTEVETQVLRYENGDTTAATPEAPTKAGYIFGGWTLQNGDGEAYDFSTALTGHITLIAKWIEIPVPRFDSYSLFLGGKIGLNFYVYIPDDLAGSRDCSMSFEITGKYPLETPTQIFDAEAFSTQGGTKTYRFTCYVNVLQAAEDITATLHYGEESISTTYSVKSYLGADFSGFSDTVRELIRAIQNYVHYSQIMLADTHSLTPGTDFAQMPASGDYTTEEIRQVSDDVKPYAFVNGNSGGSGVTYIEYSLNLDSSTAINIYFTVSDDYTGNVGAYLGSGTENLAVRQGSNSNVYRVQIDDIPAHELGTPSTVRIAAAKEFEVRFSALSYVNTVLDYSPDNEAVCKAVTALYKYYTATMAYRKSLNN